MPWERCGTDILIVVVYFIVNLFSLALIGVLQVGFEMFFVAEGLQVNSELEKRERGGVGGGSLEMELAAGSFHYIFSSFPGTAAPRE